MKEREDGWTVPEVLDHLEVRFLGGEVEGNLSEIVVYTDFNHFGKRIL